MEKTIKSVKYIKIDDKTNFLITETNENKNIISMTTWEYSAGHGVTTFDKDTAIKLANYLLEIAGSGNK